MPRSTDSSFEHLYSISTVSTLTGIDANTIRAWERRYAAISPARTDSGRRRYDERAVDRLQLLKALVDCNEPIGSVANLPDDVLRERLEKLAELGRHRPVSEAVESIGFVRRRLVLMAPVLERQIRSNAVAIPEIELAVSVETGRALLQSVRRDPCDLVVIELESLEQSPVEFIQTCRSLPGSPLVVVLYRFARRTTLSRLAQAGARLVQTPIRLEQLRRVLLDLLIIDSARGQHPTRIGSPSEAAGEAKAGRSEGAGPARMFDDDQLARLFEISTGVDCECPNHLSSLVSALVAFERYSRSCESRDEADARLHRMLAAGTAEARAQLERLLAALCEQEGIKV
jgi:hypothetical protein